MGAIKTWIHRLISRTHVVYTSCVCTSRWRCLCVLLMHLNFVSILYTHIIFIHIFTLYMLLYILLHYYNYYYYFVGDLSRWLMFANNNWIISHDLQASCRLSSFLIWSNKSVCRSKPRTPDTIIIIIIIITQ